MVKKKKKIENWMEDGREVGGCGVHLSAQRHQEYVFRSSDTEVLAEHQMRKDRST